MPLMNDFRSQTADPSSDEREPLGRTPRPQGPQLPPEVLGTRSGVPLSFAQEQLWFLDQMEPGNPAYNICAAVRVRGALDTVALAQALRAVVSRHEVLRTTYPARDGQPVQAIAPAPTLDVRITDLGSVPPSDREGRARGLAVEEGCNHFDLARGPLARADLLRVSEEEHMLLHTIQHVAE